jgi:hypothetical protein
LAWKGVHQPHSFRKIRVRWLLPSLYQVVDNSLSYQFYYLLPFNLFLMCPNAFALFNTQSCRRDEERLLFYFGIFEPTKLFFKSLVKNTNSRLLIFSYAITAFNHYFKRFINRSHDFKGSDEDNFLFSNFIFHKPYDKPQNVLVQTRSSRVLSRYKLV